MTEQHKAQTSGNFEYHLVEGTLYITHQMEPERQLALTPEQAYDLLDYLYQHRDDLYHRLPLPEPPTDLPEAVKAWLQAKPAVEAYNREHPFVTIEEEEAAKPPSEKYLEIRLYQDEWGYLDELKATIPTLHEDYEAPNSNHYEDDLLIQGPAVKVLSCKIANLSQEALHLLNRLQLETSVRDVLIPTLHALDLEEE